MSARVERRHVIAGGAALTWLVVARLWFGALAAHHEPHIDIDSRTYLEIAAQPAKLAHLAYPKPWTVPAAYRLVDAKPARIVVLQRELAFWSWALFAAALVATRRRDRARIAAAIVGLALMLAPTRVGFTAAVLSESISDSLLALVGAAALAMTWEKARPWAAGALAVVAPLWILARDVNAVAALVAVVVAAAWWRPRPSRRVYAWAAPLVAIVVITSFVQLYAAAQIPKRPTGLTYYPDWLDEPTARNAIPAIDNLFQRVLPYADGRDFYIARGLPWSPDLQRFATHPAHYDGEIFLTDARYRPVHQWLRAHGTRTYALYLVRHPLETAYDIGHNGRAIFGVRSLRAYMPAGWHGWGDGTPASDGFRWSTESVPIVLLLIALAPFAFRRARGPLRGIAACAIASGLHASIIAVLADSIERPRHAWGTSQLMLVGLVAVALAALDEIDAPLIASRPPDPR